MSAIELTPDQIRGIVRDFTYFATEQDVKWLLKMVTQNRRNNNDHTELVKFYMKLVVKECCLPKDFFK